MWSSRCRQGRLELKKQEAFEAWTIMNLRRAQACQRCIVLGIHLFGVVQKLRVPRHPASTAHLTSFCHLQEIDMVRFLPSARGFLVRALCITLLSTPRSCSCGALASEVWVTAFVCTLAPKQARD